MASGDHGAAAGGVGVEASPPAAQGRTLNGRLTLFLGGTLALGAVAAGVGYLLDGERGLIYSAVACGLCMVPALATLLWGEWSFRRSPKTFVFVALAGNGIRMFGVLVAGALVFKLLPYFGTMGFAIWVVVFYLITLALEMTALLAGRTKDIGL